jgi:ectoine hydroxylase-related dioxygenase (phytanoyl-CoA dioxygenase family)
MGTRLRDEEIRAFERDGVVCLRGVLDREWLARLADAVERELTGTRSADLSAMARGIEAGGGEIVAASESGAFGEVSGRFVAGTDHWRQDATFRAFAIESPLPALAAGLMRSTCAYLYEDSLLVKEPGTREATAFHQDMGYFHVSGDQACTTWCPLDRVTTASGALRYVRGSHRWDRVFKPNLFVTRAEIPGAEGEAVPEIEADPDAFDLVSFDLEPGDVAVHHARTIHGAFPNASPHRRRAVSVRYCGDDARYKIRPGVPTKPHHANFHDGDPLGGPDSPCVWPPVD